MRITPIEQKPISFKLKTTLKTEWLKGNMPNVQFDIGGNRITAENITNGHMLAKSKGGASTLNNITLESLPYNMMKGNRPFSWFFDTKAFMKYCEEMQKINLPNFNGKEYVKGIIETAFNLLKDKK